MIDTVRVGTKMCPPYLTPRRLCRGFNQAIADHFLYHEKNNYSFAGLSDAVVDIVDSVGLQVFTIWQLAYLSSVSNLSASFALPYRVNYVEYTKNPFCSICFRTLGYFFNNLVRLSYIDIKRFALTRNSTHWPPLLVRV